MSIVDYDPDIVKMLLAADHHISQDDTSAATCVWTVPTSMTWIVYMALLTNGNRVSTGMLSVNDGTAYDLLSGVAEGANLIPNTCSHGLILKAGHTLTITDEAFVGGDAVTKTLIYWEMQQT